MMIMNLMPILVIYDYDENNDNDHIHSSPASPPHHDNPHHCDSSRYLIYTVLLLFTPLLENKSH